MHDIIPFVLLRLLAGDGEQRIALVTPFGPALRPISITRKPARGPVFDKC